ncbi:ribonuclease D [Seongchinamella sediminis]|uniref:Ribonuclease D n=1 Tax=Seongchinamella sediminis TaxID=2283635 RepID=A0A3L7E3E1_9GAMM|nr:ribonuclease D [Seongchinamella sediminis]RLQ22921.1 ribonuclease D [Seongchinamella sediminis]
MDWTLIESDAALAELLASAAGSQAVMVDTEFMRRNTFYPQVALVQLCFAGSNAAGTAWLVDPLQIGDPAPLAALFADPQVVKVLHSASEDLEVFQHWLGVLPRPLFDTQKAAAMVGLDFGLGYRAMVLELCGEDLPKGETRSDWLQRPLTESQCHYAAQDVIWLLDAYRTIEQRCREQGRYDWVLEDGEVACQGLASTAGDYYRKIKSAWKLSPRELAKLVAICDWRETTARDKDKPRSWIIDDKACLQLAQKSPANMNELRAAVELHPASLRRYGEALLDVLAEQSACGDVDLPARLPAPLDASQRNTLKRLKRETENIARGLGVAPQALVAGKDYEALIRGDAEQPDSWSGWRRELIIEPLQALLAREVE